MQQRTLSEHDSKARLAAFGVPVAPERLVASADAAADAAVEIGFPVVVKACGDLIAHKTERGLVRLGLRDADAVRAAAAELLGLLTPDDGDTALLVAQMVKGNRELIAGVVDDPNFGRCVMVGIGGIFTEALADVVFRLVPVSRTDAAEMLDDLTNQAMLGALRGEPAVERDAAIDVIVGLSALADADPDVVGVDVNPLIVVDGVPVAVDALVVLADADAHTDAVAGPEGEQ